MNTKITEYQLMDAAAFNKLDKYGKRVAICEDVLKRIAAGKIVPVAGWLVHNRYEIQHACRKSSLKESINQMPCEVCAKGSLLCSFIGNFNKYTVEDFKDFKEQIQDENCYPSELMNIFGRNLLDAIEIAFEGQVFEWDIGSIKELKQLLIEEFPRETINENAYDSDGNEIGNREEDEEILIKVMRNIIKNKGELVLGSGKSKVVID